jgi:hypothetical protein
VIWSLVLALQLGVFLIVTLVVRKTAWEIAGPYLATFVAPGLIFVPVAMGLRKW